MTTIEFYAGPLGIRLIGAVTVPGDITSSAPSGHLPLKGKAYENAKAVGKVLCKINHLNELEAVLIDEAGDETDKFMVYR